MLVRRPKGARRSDARRSGAAALETAVIMIPIVMVFFGVFEFGRFCMDLNVLNHAAREGCRYALVRNTVTTIHDDVKALVTAKIGRRLPNFDNLTVTTTGKRMGVVTPVNELAPGDEIIVSVSGGYRFMNIIPFVTMPAAFKTESAVTMCCEGGT
jgi:Flp pilus assembly protein TadG